MFLTRLGLKPSSSRPGRDLLAEQEEKSVSTSSKETGSMTAIEDWEVKIKTLQKGSAP